MAENDEGPSDMTNESLIAHHILGKAIGAQEEVANRIPEKELFQVRILWAFV